MGQGLTFHMFVTVFDAYMLYKSNLALGKSFMFTVVTCLCLVYRMGWVAADIALTFLPVSWDPAQQLCLFKQDPLAALNYTIADVLADLVSSAATMAAFSRQGGFEMDMYGLSFQLVKEAALRSLVCLGMDVFFVVVVFRWSSAGQNVAYAVQNLIYLKVINMELWWKEVRENQHLTLAKASSELYI
ncbi:hypothetical protein BC830DRAFT_891456 [Chytriomyces sp. MP71]|nr:hypothetical protein BC830DRAFT_891456 [Chytriomyces sp. MP71]